MNTFLGACQNLTSADLNPADIAAARILYLEGYLWDPPAAKQTFVEASRIAHVAGREAALTLSDVFCVDRHQQELLGLMRGGFVDILFANKSELHALYQTSDFATAVAALRQEKVIAAVTRSEKGAIVVHGEKTFEVPAAPIDNLVDTTGAGDLFAAGFLAAYTRGRPLDYCARLGALAASEIIQHFGARPGGRTRPACRTEPLSARRPRRSAAQRLSEGRLFASPSSAFADHRVERARLFHLF